MQRSLELGCTRFESCKNAVKKVRIEDADIEGEKNRIKKTAIVN